MRTSSPIVPERALLHPLWLAALVLLIANDHFLKGSGLLHHVSTGKLSDVAGLVVAPLLLATLVRARSRRALLICHLAIGAGFAATEISTTAADALVALMNVAGSSWRMWPDLTDLLALPALWLSWRWLVPAAREPLVLPVRLRALGVHAAVTAGTLACLGTSSVQQPVAPPPIIEGAVYLRNGSGQPLDVTVESLGNDGGDCDVLRDNRESLALAQTHTQRVPANELVVALRYPPPADRCTALRISAGGRSHTLVLRGAELALHRTDGRGYQEEGVLHLDARLALSSAERYLSAALAPEPQLDLAALAGRWRARDPKGAWSLEYRFAPPSYLASGTPPYDESGTISLLEREDRRLRVRFAERQLDGERDDDLDRWIAVSEDGKSLRIGEDTFERLDNDVTVAEQPAPVEVAAPPPSR